MEGYIINVEQETVKNNNYRRVLYTSPNYQQLVVMSLRPREEIGLEVHNENDQFIRIEAGIGLFQLGNEYYEIGDGVAMIVPAGTYHNVINTSQTNDLKLYTIYTPPHHPDQLIQKYKPSDED